MDPITSIGLAGSIVAFIDFSYKLFTSTRKIYSSASGAHGDGDSLPALTTGLRGIAQKLRSAPDPPGRGPPDSSDELKVLATNCDKAALELLGVLDKLAPKDKTSIWDSFLSALKTEWEKEKVEEMSRRLDSFRLQMILQLQLLSREDSDVTQSLNALSQKSTEMGSALSSDIASLRKEMRSALEELRVELKLARSFVPTAVASPSQNSKALNLDEKVEKIQGLARRGHDLSQAIGILRGLYFAGMESRYDRIVTAHPSTCQWAFESDFTSWMKSNSFLFWVSGKPGSGKSTLMKYVAENPRTAACLQEWSPPVPEGPQQQLLIASYFFWINGSKTQRSQEGLLRSILFDILRQRPELLDIILSSQVSKEGIKTGLPTDWTFPRSLSALKSLLHHTKGTRKYCIFVDGLDEYEGDHENLVEFLEGMRIFPNLKLCVASRPWPLFEDSFGADEAKKLYMQDLNAEDIESFVHDKLSSHPTFRKLRESEPEANLIVREIVQKAYGVFLWVYLVTRSLLQGFRNKDRLSDLKRRLHEFPSDLNKFFSYILDSLDPVYKVQVVRGFEATMAAQRRLSVAHFWHLDQEEELGRDYAVEMQIPRLPYDKVLARANDRTETMKARINGRFKGLLEVRLESRGEEDQDTIRERYEKDYLSKVDFLHRTVQDFLLTTDCREQLSAWRPSNFDVNYSLAQTYLADLKELAGNPWHESVSLTVRYLKDGILDSVKQYEARTGQVPTPIFQELSRVLHAPFVGDPNLGSTAARTITLWDGLVSRPDGAPVKTTTSSFLAWLILTDEPSFLKALLPPSGPDLSFDEKKSLLEMAVSFLSYDIISILATAFPQGKPFLSRAEVVALLKESQSQDKLEPMMAALSQDGLCEDCRSSRSKSATPGVAPKKKRLGALRDFWKGRSRSPSKSIGNGGL